MQNTSSLAGRLLNITLIATCVLSFGHFKVIAQDDATPSSRADSRSASDESQFTEFSPDRSPADLDRLIAARMAGKRVVVLVATDLNLTGAVVADATALGADVQVRFDDVGYLRVVLPVERYPDLLRIRGVVHTQIDVALPKPTCTLVEKASSARAGRPFPGEAYSKESAFIPAAKDMGVNTLRRAHPSFDGRGVTIGVIEGGACQGIGDVLHPSLLNALSINGQPVPKLAGVITPIAYEPLDSRQEGATGEMFIDRQHPIRVSPVGAIQADETGTMVHAGKRLIAPSAGKWSLGYYLNEIAVVWNEKNQGIWVDTDGDGDLLEEKEMADVNVRFNAGTLRIKTDKGNPAERTFVVMFDAANRSVLLIPGRDAHVTMVSGVAAGQYLIEGGSDSPAPSARIVAIYTGTLSSAAHVEAYVHAVRDKRVDIITDSQGNNESDVMGVILGRLLSRYPKPILLAAGNGGSELAGVWHYDPQQRGDRSAGPFTVGAYFNRDTYRAFFETVLPRKDNVWRGSRRGPRQDGRIAPDVIAPIYSFSPRPCSTGPLWGDSDSVYRFPACYGLSGGTSAASPTAAGAVAVLLSAARQTAGTPTDSASIFRAVRDGARFLDGYGAYEQGNGLIDVPAAWKRLSAPSDPRSGEIKVEAPLANNDLPRNWPGKGIGLFEREGWTAGRAGARTIKLTRTTGPNGTVALSVRWRGNDGTFSTKDKLLFPLNKTLDVEIRIVPKTPGVHSAILELADSSTKFGVRSVPVTIVAAHEFTRQNKYSVSGEAVVPWPDSHGEYFQVSDGTGSLVINTTVQSGAMRLTLSGPRSGWLPYADDRTLKPGESGRIVVQNPEAGTWELKYLPCLPTGDCNGVRHTAQAQGPGAVTFSAEVFRAEDVLDVSAAKGRAGSRAYDISFASRFSDISNAEIRTEIGVRNEEVRMLRSNEIAKPVEIDVEPGTTSLRVTAKKSSKGPAPEMRLYYCGEGRCRFQGLRHEESPKQSMIVDSPKEGRWVVLLVGDIPSSEVMTVNVDVVRTHPRYGTASLSTEKDMGAGWRARIIPAVLTGLDNNYDMVLVADLIGRTKRHVSKLILMFDDQNESIPSAVVGKEGNLKKRIPRGELPLATAIRPIKP